MIDLSSFKDLYIKTARDDVAQLKSALEMLLINMSDMETVGLAHRTVHSLKSKTLMMGDSNIGALAGAIEDVLSDVKAGKKVFTAEMVRVLVEGAEKLQSAIMLIPISGQQQQAVPVAPVSQNIPGKIVKVLVMEDDVFFQKFYATKLGEVGFSVKVAVDGVDGMKKLQEEKPDVILLDIIMPNKDGFEVLKLLSEDTMLKTIPVIVFSSLGQEQDVQRAMNLGAKDYINKSFYHFDELLTKIANVTKSS